MNWKQAARVFRLRWLQAEDVADLAVERLFRNHERHKERVRQLEAALEEIARCNDGKGYMPELAQRALKAAKIER